MNRPPEFDAALVAYLPGLRKRANFVTKTNAEAEELLQETVADMLGSWHLCRMETFKMWAQLKMWQVQFDLRQKAGRMKRRAATVSIDDAAGTSKRETGRASVVPERCRIYPSQEHAVELAQVIDRLSRIPNGDIVLRRATGELLKDIGAENGTSRENIRQKEERALRTLRLRTGRAAA